MEGTEGSSATEMTLSVSEFTQQEIHTDLPIAILAFFYTQFSKLVKKYSSLDMFTDNILIRESDRAWLFIFLEGNPR